MITRDPIDTQNVFNYGVIKEIIRDKNKYIVYFGYNFFNKLIVFTRKNYLIP